MDSLSLSISPSSLEERFWCRRCNSRLNSLDTLYELCNSLIWLSILPMLEGSDRVFGKCSLLLAVIQLVAIQLTPRLWFKGRSMLLSSALLLRCMLLLAQSGSAAREPTMQQYGSQPQLQADGSIALDTDLAASITVAAGVWGNLLFVLFHQQPVRVQVPLLAVTSLLQACCAGSSSFAGNSHASTAWPGSNSTINTSTTSAVGFGCSAAGSSSGLGLFPSWVSLGQGHDAELAKVSKALHWGFGLLAAGGINSESGIKQLAALQPATSLLATKLFVHGFGGFLLPVFVAYLIEWRYKVTFLLTACNLPQQQQLRVLTPAAAIVRASVLLAVLLYMGWLLLLATCTWLLCCAVASLLSS